MHINYNLNEDLEIIHKQGDFISRVNSFMYSFGCSTSRVLTVLLDSKCNHVDARGTGDLKQG